MLKMGSDIVNKTNIGYLSECCFSLLKNNSDAMINKMGSDIV